MKELRDRVAVVTGAASGIGRAMVACFAAEGMRIVLADVEENALERARAEISAGGARVVALRTDVSNPGEVDALAEQAYSKFGAVHVVCNNAGVALGRFMWEFTIADWQWVLGVNLWGVIHGVRSFVPRMIAQGDEGHVVNTASVAGLTSVPRMGAYNVSKHAVVTLSETLQRDLLLAGSKIGVSVLCPGFVSTRIMDSERNRPSRLMDQGTAEPTPENAMFETMGRQLVAAGLAPERVAEHVRDAVRAARFYVLPHPEFKDAIRQRMNEIVEERNPTLEVPIA